MPRTVSELLEAMRVSQSNWTREDLETLYKGFGFNIRTGAKHDIAIHTQYRNLRGTLPNHKSFAKGYVSSAIKLVDQLRRLVKQGGKNDK